MQRARAIHTAAALVFVVAIAQVSALEVGGVLTEDAAWSLADSPVIVTHNLLAPEGVTVTVAPGVHVLFRAGTRLDVGGQLIAIGTGIRPIVFTSVDSVSPSSWDGIGFLDTSIDAAVDANRKYISGSALIRCEISYGRGVRAYGSSPYIGSCFIHHLGPQLEELANRTDGAIHVIGPGQSQMVIVGNVITDNATSGIMLWGRGSSSPTRVQHNVITNNRMTEMHSGPSGGGISLWAAAAGIHQNTVRGNYSRWGAGGVRVDGGAVVIRNNWVVGNSAGTATTPARDGAAAMILAFTSGSDLIVRDNEISGNSGTTAFWVGMSLNGGQGGKIALGRNNIRNNVVGSLLTYYPVVRERLRFTMEPNYWGGADIEAALASMVDVRDDFGRLLFEVAPSSTELHAVSPFPALHIDIVEPVKDAVLPTGTAAIDLVVSVTGAPTIWQWRLDEPFPAQGLGGGTLVRDTLATSVAGLAPGSHTLHAALVNYQGRVRFPQPTARVSFTIAASNDAPIARAGADRDVAAGAPVVFDASASADPDGQVVAYVWHFGDEGQADTRVASHTYAAPGTYTVTLTVTDDRGATAMDTAVVNVQAPASLGISVPEAPRVGDTFEATIGIADAVGVAGVQFDLVYDATRLEVVDLSEGGFFFDSGAPTFFDWSPPDASGRLTNVKGRASAKAPSPAPACC